MGSKKFIIKDAAEVSFTKVTIHTHSGAQVSDIALTQMSTTGLSLPIPHAACLTLVENDRDYGRSSKTIGKLIYVVRPANGKPTPLSSTEINRPGVLHVAQRTFSERAESELCLEEKEAVFDAVASINWSRTNPQWVLDAKLGVWGKPKGVEMEQVVLRGAGRNNTQAIINFLRSRTGLDEKLKASRRRFR